MNLIFIIGQILLGGYFIYSGFKHFKDINILAGYAHSKNVPQAKFAVLFTGVMMLVGGFSVLTGFAAEIGLWVLIAYMIPVTVIMHQFWKAPDPIHRANEQIQFAKNIALIGALLMIVTG